MSHIAEGSTVYYEGKAWTVVDIPSLNQVLLREHGGKRIAYASVNDVKSSPNGGRNTKSLIAYAEEDWDEAATRLRMLQPLLNREPRKRTTAEIDEVAAQLGKDRATVYRWLRKYDREKGVSALMRKERTDRGGSRLINEVDAVITDKINSFYLKKERPTVTELYEEIQLACRAKGLKKPHESTVRRRVQNVDARITMTKRYSSKKARETFEPIRGSLPGADVPLAIYQIDHTPIDMIFVDEMYRESIGRGYLTTVMDCCPRTLAGFYVTFDSPSALSAGMALANAILPKGKWLLERNIDTSWPIYGIPRKIFLDNAPEFRGVVIDRGCEEYNIIRENRPKGLPNFGGHIERLFRTFMKRVQRLEGTTFSNVVERAEYNSEGKAVMTLSEFERWFTLFVTKVYHQRPHRGIGKRPPIKLYEQYILGTPEQKGIGLPGPIENEQKLYLDFMPFVDRTIQEYGVLIDHVYYYADILKPWIHATDPNNEKLKRKFIFVRDPRDISIVYFLDPDTKSYFPIPYRNVTRPRMSLWELRAVLKKLESHPELQPDEELIFEGLAEMRKIEQEAAEKSKKARRTQQRRINWQSQAIPQSHHTQKPTEAISAGSDDEAVQPFEEIEESL